MLSFVAACFMPAWRYLSLAGVSPQATTEEDLEIIFSRFGAVTSCDIIRDFKTGAPAACLPTGCASGVTVTTIFVPKAASVCAFCTASVCVRCAASVRIPGVNHCLHGSCSHCIFVTAAFRQEMILCLQMSTNQ